MKRLIQKPELIERFETKLGNIIPLHANLISLVKLFILTPLIVFSLQQVALVNISSSLTLPLFIVFLIADYLDGVVARSKQQESKFGRVLDRLTDYPLLIILLYFAAHQISTIALIIKIMIDSLLFILYILKKGSTENRLRTGISYVTLIALLCLSQGYLVTIFNHEFVNILLWLNIGFSAIVAAYNLRLLQKRFIADSISFLNLLCGIASMYFAYYDRLEISLLFLLLGAAFDGFDGAAARKWGGTRWGVYSDDIADGVNYGIAPGVACYFLLGGLQGLVIGLSFALFTISRLVFFTLNKNESDPNYFSGVPSTIGGIIVLCSLILFQPNPVILGFMIGIACTLMVSFDSAHKHLGRAIADYKPKLGLLPFIAVLFFICLAFFQQQIAVAITLSICLFYGFLPTVKAFRTA